MWHDDLGRIIRVRKARVDANHGEIVQALRQVGASVQSLASIGDGCPDLLVHYRRRVMFLEVKTPKGKLRPAQVRWMKNWPDLCAVVRSVDEALKAIGAAK